MKFENVLEELGFGRFQLRTVFLLVIPRITLPMNFLLNNFIATIPSHHCDFSSLDDGGVFVNLTWEQKLAVSIPLQEDGTPSSCQMFALPQYQLLLNDSSNMTDLPVVPCQNGWVHNNTVFSSTLASEWDLVCDNRSLNRSLTTIFFLGVMFGAAIIGTLSDRFGRKTMLLVSILIALIFGVASAFSSSLAMYAVLRFITGFGLTGISIITMVLCIEWVDIKRRTPVGVFLSLDWSICATILPGVAYLVNDWRYLTATVVSPLVLALITWWWVPESARWLIANGKVDRAHYYLNSCAKVNRSGQFKPETLSKTIVVDGENRTYSYIDLVRTPKMRRLSLIAGCVWCAVACTYYGISLNVTGFGADIYVTQFFYGAIELPAKAAVYFSLRKIGRRVNQAFVLGVTGACILLNIFIPQEMPLFRTVVGVLGKGFSEASFIIVYLYTTELFPTVMRQNGLGCSSAMSRLGVCIAPLIILLEDTWHHLPGVIFSLIAFSGMLLALQLPETRNVRLPETIEDIEQTRRQSICTSE